MFGTGRLKMPGTHGRVTRDPHPYSPCTTTSRPSASQVATACATSASLSWRTPSQA